MVLTDLFIKRPVLALVVNLVVLLVGLRALFDLPIRQYPALETAVITVSTGYPGASPSLMQGFVTTPIARAIASAEGVEYLVSNSRQSSSSVEAHLRLGADSGAAMTEIMAKVNEVKYLIPRESNDPVITKSTGERIALMYIGFASDELTIPAITDYLIRVVQPMLATVDGVASAEIIGGQTLAMRVWLDPSRMAARGITASDVSAALRTNNYQSAPGQMKGVFIVTNIETNTDLNAVEQFRDLVVKSRDGALVRLKDIGTIELGAENYDQNALMNGKTAVYLGVRGTPTGNPLTIVQDVKVLLKDLERSKPPSMSIAVPYDSTVFIQASIDEVVKTLLEAVGIVVVVIFLFLGTLRSVIIPIVTIPLSLIGAAFLMLAMGFSLNLLTLLAMVMAIGLVVDDAIVVVENVYRHVEKGLTPVQAAIKGAREIVGPVIAMTITLAAVYAPIGFMGGLTGTLFREFAFTLAGAVLISGFVAITLSPVMCSLFLKHGMNETGFARRVETFFSRIENAYGRRLHATLDYRPVTALFAAVVLASLWFLYSGAQKELAPEEDVGVVITASKGPAYANIDYTAAFARKVENIFAEFPERKASFVLNGMGAPSDGFAGMTLKPWDERTRSTKDIQPEIQQAVGGIEGQNIFVFLPPALPGSEGGLPVQMVIRSTEDYESVWRVMETLKTAARESGMFMVTDSDLNFNTPTVEIAIDHTKAGAMGITMQGIGDTLALLLGGNYVNRFTLNGRSYDVIPQVPRSLRLTPDDLTRYYVPTGSGALVPISSVADVRMESAPNALTQFNQMNSATFQAIPFPGVSMGAAIGFLEAKAAEILPRGYDHDYLSNSRQFVQEGNALLITFAFALLAIFLVLAAQFESLRDPLVILVSVPLAVCGALIPLFLGLASVNIYTQIGLVTLIGLIAKHGILMTEFANQAQIEQGLDRRAAIELAARVRLRPILMTTAATVMGLVPLLLASGAGAASRFSIGLVIVVGMSVGTLFTLFVLPAVYTAIARDHAAASRSARAAQIRDVTGG
ncbi:MAG: efflux RND transporter permease subunit [Rhodospirillales bacterium]|nr:efflux RND transporter permease subunit [Rhodospirillales bacterium]